MAVLTCILGGLPKDDRVASFRFLKSTPRRHRNSENTLYRRYCKVFPKLGFGNQTIGWCALKAGLHNTRPGGPIRPNKALLVSNP